MTVSTGIAMEIHYCMGEKAGIGFYNTDNEKCGRCGMTEKEGGCCSDEHKFYKLNDSHKNAINDLSLKTGEFCIAAVIPVFDWQVRGIVSPITISEDHSPPDYTTASFRSLNGVFRL